MTYSRIAVLSTFHNRKETTKECLTRLANQIHRDDYEIDLFAVDDGSTDGTADAIKNIIPNTTIIKGNGKLFWSGGMRVAFSESVKKGYDFYLWLNDDTMLMPNAVEKLFHYSKTIRDHIGNDVILAGSLYSKKNGKVAYGGKRFNPFRPKTLPTITPSDKPKRCDVVNGNCVLITNQVARLIGNLSPEFIHAAADYDYSLRAAKYGITSWITPGFVGSCSVNPIKTNILKRESTMTDKLNALSKEATMMRIKDSMVFIKKHGKISYPTFLFNLSYSKILLFVAYSWKRLGGKKNESVSSM